MRVGAQHIAERQHVVAIQEMTQEARRIFENARFETCEMQKKIAILEPNAKVFETEYARTKGFSESKSKAEHFLRTKIDHGKEVVEEEKRRKIQLQTCSGI